MRKLGEIRNGVLWMPPVNGKVFGKIVETTFEVCFCKEGTRNGTPRWNCKRCHGKGGVTLIWTGRPKKTERGGK